MEMFISFRTSLFSLLLFSSSHIGFSFFKKKSPFSTPGKFFRFSHGHLPAIHFLASIALPPGKLPHALSKIRPKLSHWQSINLLYFLNSICPHLRVFLFICSLSDFLHFQLHMWAPWGKDFAYLFDSVRESTGGSGRGRERSRLLVEQGARHGAPS